ncbi:MAG: hypothetical protein AAGD14_06875 [Planctomycetota bacterium]
MRWTALVFCFAIACGGGGSDPAPQVDRTPVEQPDVVLLTVSGRNLDLLDFFCPPECNEAYLGEAGDAGEAVFTELTNRGLTVEVENYIAAWDNFEGPLRFGARQLIRDLEEIYETWVKDQAEPTRIVILAHSHGAVWAHNVIAALPDIPIDILVSIDGVTTQWESDHADSLTDWFNANGNPFAFDLRDVSDAWLVNSVARDTKDVAFDTIGVNIEVQSNDFLIFDDVDNLRIDGSETGIRRLFASGDDHGEVHEPGTEAMNFVIDEIVLALFGP